MAFTRSVLQANRIIQMNSECAEHVQGISQGYIVHLLVSLRELLNAGS